MTTINKSTKKNPLADEKWLKEFAEGWQKDIKKSERPKTSSCGWVGEINCTQEDIGEPNYPQQKKRSKK